MNYEERQNQEEEYNSNAYFLYTMKAFSVMILTYINAAMEKWLQKETHD